MEARKLRKELTITQVTAMAAGGMIAAWMVEIIYWFDLSGPGSFWALLVTGIFVLPLGLIYSEMTSMLPLAGGEALWVANAFNTDIGWYFTWALFFLYFFAIPNVAYGLVTMVNYLHPMPFIQIKIISVLLLLFWFFVSYARVKMLGKLQNILFWSMVAAALYTSLNFVLSPEWKYSNVTPWFPEGLSGFGAAVGILIFKYIGFGLIPQIAEEANYPRKSHWKVYASAIAITFIVYGLAIIGNAGIVSRDWILNASIVDPNVADLIGKHYLAIVIVVAGILGTLTTLTGFWLAAARTLFGASRQRILPDFVGRLNQSGQPKYANLFVAIFALYFAILAPHNWIQYMYTLYAFVAGVVYLSVTVSFLVLRFKQPDWERPFRVKAGIFFGLLSVFFCIWIIYSSASNGTASAALALGVYFLIGVVLHAVSLIMRRLRPSTWSPILITPEFVDRGNDKSSQ